MINDEEWIFIPSEIQASFVVDAKDNLEMLLWMPELNEHTDGVESFVIKLVFIGNDGQRYESDPVRQNISASEKLRFIPSIIQNSDGMIELDLKSELN